MSSYTINDLPRFSPWPALLLGSEPCLKRYKTPEEVTREYEYDKWGPLLNKVQMAEKIISLEEVDNWIFEDLQPSLCWIKNRLELLSPHDAHRQYLSLVCDTLKPFMPATSLVELGAGYGSVIIALAQFSDFAGTPIIAGEYTTSGMQLLKYLARSQNLAIEVGHCDFASAQVFNFVIPRNSVIFTSYAAAYVSKLSANFIKCLCKCKPNFVIHFEPCYEHCDQNTLLGLMRRRYIEVNDYNTNLIKLLHEQQEEGNIKIIKEEPTVFGNNPLLSVSAIIWKPMTM
jgi:hypothetical protein